MFTFKYEKELVKYILDNQEKHFTFKIIYNEYYIDKFNNQVDLIGIDKENIYFVEVKRLFISKKDLKDLIKIRDNLKMLKRTKCLLIGTKISEEMKKLIRKEKDIEYFIMPNAECDLSLNRPRKYNQIKNRENFELLINIKYNFLFTSDNVIKTEYFPNYFIITYKYNNGLGINLKIDDNDILYYEIITFDRDNEGHYETIKKYTTTTIDQFMTIKEIVSDNGYIELISLYSSTEKAHRILIKRLKSVSISSIHERYDVKKLINVYLKKYKESGTEREIFEKKEDYIIVEKIRSHYEKNKYIIIVRFTCNFNEYSFIRDMKSKDYIKDIVECLREEKISIDEYTKYIDYVNKKYLIKKLYIIIQNKVYKPKMNIFIDDKGGKILQFYIETSNNKIITYNTNIDNYDVYYPEFSYYGYNDFTGFNEDDINQYIFLNSSILKKFTDKITRYINIEKQELSNKYLSKEITEEYNKIVNFLSRKYIELYDENRLEHFYNY
jgi:hypothetical protein